MFITFPAGDNMDPDDFDILAKFSSYLILLLAMSGLIIIHRLQRKGITIIAKVDKYIFHRKGVNTYRISYMVNGKKYIVMASESDNTKKEEVEIWVSKKYPWIMIDKFQASGIAKFILTVLIVTSLMWILPLYKILALLLF